MELRSRTERLLRPQAPTSYPAAGKGTHKLASLEVDAASHCQLRGALCLLAVAVFILSLADTGSRVGDLVIHVVMLLLSLGGEVCLVLLYRIKARVAGFTNHAGPARGGHHILHSPHTGAMLAEMAVWVLQSPPGLPTDTTAAQVLDSLVLLRAYVFLLFLTHVASRGLFGRAIAALGGARLNSSFFLQHGLLYGATAGQRAAALLAGWLAASLLYSKGEDVGLGDASFFCLNTAAFVGFGDTAPYTYTGRLAAVLAWAVGGLALLWTVTWVHSQLRVRPAERNAYQLYRTNKLCARMPGEAARTIQRAWKLYVAKREGRGALSRQWNAYLLTNQAASFRDLRRAFVACETAFLRSTVTFAELYPAHGASASASASRLSSPALTPRGSRRPFALFRDVKAKPKTPRSPALLEDSLNHSSAPPGPGSRPRSPLSFHMDAARGFAGASASGSGSGVGNADVGEVTRRLAALEKRLDSVLEQADRLLGRNGDNELES